MKISITLPSLNAAALNKTIDNIRSATKEHQHEILACTPFPIVTYRSDQGDLVWVEDMVRSGCVAAHYAAYTHATGDLITAFADDHSYVDGWDVLVVENFLRRESEGQGPFSLGLRQVSNVSHVGTMFGIYYPYFPVMRLADVKAIGGWYDATTYKRGFSDPDLGLRVWTAGGRCEWADAQTIIVNEDDHKRRIARAVPDYMEDLPVFRNKWAPLYGMGWDLTYMRCWNIDAFVAEFPAGTRTCFRDRKYVIRFARMADI